MGFAQDELTHDAFLGGKLHLWQPRKGYRAATDPVLLAASCPAKPGQTVLELGCGVGTASLCLHTRVPVKLTGIELQSAYAALARRNSAEVGTSMDVIEADLAHLPADIRARSFDHVLLNPPYYGPGTASPDQGRDTALREQTPLAAWIDAALRRAGPKGCVTVIHLAERVGDLIELLNSRAGLIEIKPIASRAGKPARRVLLRAHKGRAARSILHNPLVLHDGATHLSDGDDYSEEATRILRHGCSLDF
ncbi:tRNA1(Val) (adenine(37)-N6)-methyltransferase [Litoreibacter janthinus]|uniref:tRNA1(Val) A37 N6-methylase TrmN6 n=1 Tax=Litoreibacter janthinus TaxID=670154 RepID=A0A1I6FQC7_9RHOB|nr:methyltransferase domain-containing protein [Litoreibacter janthinus]SFR32152.1 tRNA1(Val) A37 N6-methylase TrmN6 [Litoreibacter janthinus]